MSDQLFQCQQNHLNLVFDNYGPEVDLVYNEVYQTKLNYMNGEPMHNAMVLLKDMIKNLMWLTWRQPTWIETLQLALRILWT